MQIGNGYILEYSLMFMKVEHPRNIQEHPRRADTVTLPRLSLCHFTVFVCNQNNHLRMEQTGRKILNHNDSARQTGQNAFDFT